MVTLKCTNSIAPTDKKAPFFVKGHTYQAEKIPGTHDLAVTGDRVRKSGGLDWQAVTAWPTGFVIVGVATFEEVKQDD